MLIVVGMMTAVMYIVLCETVWGLWHLYVQLQICVLQISSLKQQSLSISRSRVAVALAAAVCSVM